MESKDNYYAVTLMRRIKENNTKDGHEWAHILPDDLFLKKYRYDGHKFGGKAGRRADIKKSRARRPPHWDITTYELCWFPKTYEDAIELFGKLNDLRGSILLEGCNARMGFNDMEPTTTIIRPFNPKFGKDNE